MTINLRRGIVAATTLATIAAGATGCGDKDKTSESSTDSASTLAAAVSVAPDPTPSIDPAVADLSPATSGLIIPSWYDDYGGPSGVQVGQRATIALPGQTVILNSITAVPSIVDPDTGEEARAADGEQFLVVDLNDATDGSYPYTAPTVNVLVNVGGARTQVYDDATGAEPFLVSAGADTVLVLSVEGRDFEVSLPSGEVDSDPVEDLLARTTTTQDLVEHLQFDTAVFGISGDAQKQRSAYSTVVESMSLTPYLPAELAGGQGTWAPDGSAYLLGTVSGEQATRACCSWYVVKTVQTWSVTIDGREVKANRNPDFGGDDVRTAVLQVPIETASVEVTISARSIVHISSRDSDKQLDHGSQSFSVSFE